MACLRHPILWSWQACRVDSIRESYYVSLGSSTVRRPWLSCRHYRRRCGASRDCGRGASGEFIDRVEALGTLKANDSVALTAAVTETVTRIHFDDGDRVRVQQVLVEMSSAEELALLQEAQATVAEAQRQHRRVKSLEAQGTAAISLLDQGHREWETARARLAAIESRLADRLVKAPFAGVVGLRNLSVGALVEPGDLLTTLDDDSVMKLEIPVPSTYLATLRPNLTIIARARAYGSREFRGEVKSIDSRVDPVTRSILVWAVLPNTGSCTETRHADAGRTAQESASGHRYTRGGLGSSGERAVRPMGR